MNLCYACRLYLDIYCENVSVYEVRCEEIVASLYEVQFGHKNMKNHCKIWEFPKFRFLHEFAYIDDGRILIVIMISTSCSMVIKIA